MNSVLSKNQLMQETIQLTTEMGTKYPELYKFLDETPLFFCNGRDNGICTTDFEEYLETLKDQILNHIETHSKNIHGNYTR
jgi:hypothetical protein